MDRDLKLRQEPNFSIRLLGKEDGAQLLALYTANLSRLQELGLHEARIPVEEQIDDVLTPKEGSDLFGIFDQQELIGAVYITRDFSAPRSAQIGRLIDSHYQNKGIGGRALTRIMNELSNRYDRFWAMTREDNVLARKSLERAGFAAMSEPSDDSPNVLYVWGRQ
ncbi:MAG: hypothetical protein G01um10148_245 [Parcubacteria group bacterium Gr01-1014_8]|nr:MAG: hypothetical protein G01um10148_245 [Parcubacteria group bacterium Gr01-1014_8]